MKRYTLLICLLAVMGLGRVCAQENSEEWFNQANAAYNAGNYESAMTLYEQILASEVESVPLYFNMGNTYYKMREYPMAIYYYEKALKLDPSNEEVQTNLAIANQAIVDKIEPVPQSFIVRGWQQCKGIAFGRPMGVVFHRGFCLVALRFVPFLALAQDGAEEVGLLRGPCFPVGFRPVGGLCHAIEASL